MKIGGKEEGEQRTSGEIVNLMAVDSQRLQDAMTYMHTLWSGPYQIIITLVFLHWVVGWAMVAGVMVMILQIPLVTCVARSIKLAQRKLMSIKDERIKVTNEARKKTVENTSSLSTLEQIFVHPFVFLLLRGMSFFKRFFSFSGGETLFFLGGVLWPAVDFETGWL